MNTKTGDIKTLDEIEKLSEDEQRIYTPLTDQEYQKVKSQKGAIRTKTLNDMRHTQKQIVKRRAANKRNKQSRKKK